MRTSNFILNFILLTLFVFKHPAQVGHYILNSSSDQTNPTVIVFYPEKIQPSQIKRPAFADLFNVCPPAYALRAST